MADDLRNRGAQDRARINVHEQHELRYWTTALGVSEDELKRLVKEYGVSAERVREAIQRRKTA